MNLPLTFGTLPAGWCPGSGGWQDVLQKFSENLWAVIASLDSNVVIAATAPADTTKLWFKPSAMSFYYYIAGNWCWKHPLEPGYLMFLPTGKVIADIPTFDGGTAGAVTDATGPFWEEATEFKGRFPLHPDSSSTNPGDTGGESAHAITLNELPAHSHQRNPSSLTEDVHVSSGGVIAGDYSGGVVAVKQFTVTGDTGGSVAMPIMPPYYAVPIIRRTARKYRVA